MKVNSSSALWDPDAERNGEARRRVTLAFPTNPLPRRGLADFVDFVSAVVP